MEMRRLAVLAGITRRRREHMGRAIVSRGIIKLVWPHRTYLQFPLWVSLTIVRRIRLLLRITLLLIRQHTRPRIRRRIRQMLEDIDVVIINLKEFFFFDCWFFEGFFNVCMLLFIYNIYWIHG
jgi:hypothetical protein